MPSNKPKFPTLAVMRLQNGKLLVFRSNKGTLNHSSEKVFDGKSLNEKGSFTIKAAKDAIEVDDAETLKKLDELMKGIGL